jgi:uncharacterized protein
MRAIDLYYQIKPAIPRGLQITVRRALAAQKRRTAKGTWPIDPAAGEPPLNWSGWPEGKKFALILHHDVDSLRGLKRVTKLMDIEKQLGFRSCFNFVPEDYPTPSSLVRDLWEDGFEVGVHGLKHDGKLFRHPVEFCTKVPRINRYIEKWEAVGFTSPSMLRNLTWIAELNIEHSCSTFDTDPFEPQSDGVATIFPFLVSNQDGSRTYVEVPYTLPQDHALFIILREPNVDIWKRKLDWVAENGGMAVLNTHSDYMSFDGTPPGREEYSVRLYMEFLDYVRTRYAGQYWHSLPGDLARFWRTTAAAARQAPAVDKKKRALPRGELCRMWRDAAMSSVKIWIDLDNTPHVPFFIPIIRELERRGHQVVLTARDAFQVCELAEARELRFLKVGRHYGKNSLMKVIGLLWRSCQLLPFYLMNRPRLALSHGARSQNLLSNLLRLPTVLVADYEHARTAPLTHPRWTIVPEALPADGLPSKVSRVRYYRGIKEDVYAPEFKPRTGLRAELGLREDELVVTVRPPADEAHYYRPESDELFHEFMARVCRTPGVRVALLPRNVHQEERLRSDYPEWFENGRTVIPAHAVNGLDLLWVSDLVVSGGGTMNREAAALGVPVYSIFRGKTGAVDLMLEAQGRLTMIHDKKRVWSIPLVPRDRSRLPANEPRPALGDIIDHIEDIIRVERLR